jgi:SpoVK/Ycf46/Vps4 family AAA+-type ATPase
MWSASDNIFWPSKQTYDSLPPGLYRCGESPNIGAYLDKQINKTDELITLPDTVSEEILQEIDDFRNMKEAFKHRGFLHKRGIMLWGPPGSGKTSTVQLLIKLIVDTCNGIAVFIDHPSRAAACLQMLRKVESERPVIAIMEDIDALIERYGENEYLALLDGESQVDNIVYVATTNYPERLDRRFVDRPSRFDTIRYIGMPSPEARKTFLEHKEKSYSELELAQLVKLSEGYSIAHLRELIILTRCFNMPIPKAIERLDQFRTKPSSDKSPDRPAFGFAKS